MNSDALISYLHETYPKLVAHSNGKSSPPVDNYHMLLINYRPIIRRIEGVNYYGFLDLNSDQIDLVFRKSPRGFTLGGQAPGSVDRIHLNTLLSTYDTPVYCKQIERLCVDRFITVDSIDNTCEYKGVLPEFAAILLKTQDFIMLEQYVTQDISGTLRVSGINFPGMVTYARTHMSTTIKEVIKNWYQGYMLECNLLLSEIYTKFMPPKLAVPEVQRMMILDEFVPFLVKFSGVYHPILDTSVIDTLRKNYTLFRTLEPVQNSCSFTGMAIKEYLGDDPTYALYILRGNLQRLTQMQMDKAMRFDGPKRKASDMYSVYLYAKLILHTALESLGEFIFTEDFFPYSVYTVGDGEYKQVITLNIDTYTSYYSVLCEPERTVDWMTAATYNYILDRNFHAGDPQTLGEVNRLTIAFKNNLTAVSLLNLEVI